MNQQLLIRNEPRRGVLYDFFEYKKRKPFFKNPIIITLGNTEKDTYYMVKNMVYNGKQILALKKDLDSNTIILVEGKIKDGKLSCISMLPKEYLGNIGKMFEEII